MTGPEPGSRICTKCGGHRFNSWDRCMDCRNSRAKVRQARIQKNGGRHTQAEWLALLAATPCCVECGRTWEQIPPRPDGRYRHTWTKGHKVPVLHGGTDDVGNLQAECYQCNFRKNAGRLKPLSTGSTSPERVASPAVSAVASVPG